MSDTRAVPLEQLVAANMAGPYPLPLCPACRDGRLYPYKVTISVSATAAFHGAHWLEGWVAVCEGNTNYKRAWAQAFPKENHSDVADAPPCGFAMPMTQHRHQL